MLLIARSTFFRMGGETLEALLATRDTVEMDTPANRATSLMVEAIAHPSFMPTQRADYSGMQ